MSRLCLCTVSENHKPPLPEESLVASTEAAALRDTPDSPQAPPAGLFFAPGPIAQLSCPQALKRHVQNMTREEVGDTPRNRMVCEVLQAILGHMYVTRSSGWGTPVEDAMR